MPSKNLINKELKFTPTFGTQLLRIRVTQVNEQRMIACLIQSLKTKVEAEIALHSEYNQIKQGLMADLLTGKVRVNLNKYKVENG